MAEGPQSGMELTDRLLACVEQLAERFGVPFAPSMFSSLPRDVNGQLPLHQAEAIAEILGLNCDIVRKARLSRKPDAYPAIVDTRTSGSIVVHERREGDVLVWRPDTGVAQWEPASGLEADHAGWQATFFGDPTAIREGGQTLRAKVRRHWFWSEIDKLRGRFRPVWVASLLINLMALALPLFTMNVYDRVLPNRAQSTLWVLAIGVLIAFSLDYALRRARTRVLDQIGRDLDLTLSQKIYSKVLAAPLVQRQDNTGRLVARVSEFALVRDYFASTTVVLVVDLVFLVLFLVVITWLAGWLAMLPLLAMAAMLVIGFRLQRQVSQAAIEAQADHGLQQTLLVESISGMETLKSIGGEGVMLGRWRRLVELGAQSQRRLRDISSSAIGMASTFQQISSIALIIGGYYLFDAGQITMGAIIAIVMLSSRSLAPAGQIAFLLTRGKQAQQALDSLQKLWEQPDERTMGSTTVTPVVRAARLKLEDLEFSYPESDIPSLAGINLEIRPGERIAVIGRVASGKSTLGRVMCGLYAPTGGAMLVDGIDSRQYRPQELRSAFRFLGQDAGLFSGSIKDNLTIGAPSLSDEQVIDALRRIGADTFLTRDSGGFDRAVGEGGTKLSGGQRAFLSLARAFTTDARLLYLDEPTGAMDSETEKYFVERLSHSLTPQHTLIVSTHRPALFVLCDRLIVLDRGRVVADGPKDAIIKSAVAGQTS